MKPAFTLRNLILPGLLLVFVILLTGGCRKIRNKHRDMIEERSHFLFFNYALQRPLTEKEQVAQEPGVSRENRFAGRKLRAFFRRGTIPLKVVREFELETGAKVAVNYFDETDHLFEQLQHNNEYDVIMSRHYGLRRLVDDRLIRKMDLNNIPNARGIGRPFYKLSDLHNPDYALTYLWTVTGIAYHNQYFDRRPVSWNKFFEPNPEAYQWIEGRLSILPDPGQNFAAALVSMGYSPNTGKPEEMKAAEEYLREKISRYRIVDHSELGQAFRQESVVMAQATSADVALMDDSEVMFSIPEDGSWMHFDMLSISATVEDGPPMRLAEAFIDFLLRPDVAGQVVESSRHATTINRATAFIRPSIRNSVTYIKGDLDKTWLLDSNPARLYTEEEAVHQIYSLAQAEAREREGTFSVTPTPAGQMPQHHESP